MKFTCRFKYLARDVLVLSARRIHHAYSISRTHANLWVHKSHFHFSLTDTYFRRSVSPAIILNCTPKPFTVIRPFF